MKIAVVNPDLSVYGGAERVTVNLYNYLKYKYNTDIISIFSHNSNYSINEIQNLKFKKPINFINRFFFSHFPPKALIDILNNYDIIISNNVLRNYIHPKFINTKKIHIHHLIYEECADKISIKKRISIILRNRQYRNLDKLIVLTDNDNEKFSSRGFKNVETIPNGLSFVADEKAELINKQVIAIGRLQYDKGIDKLIKIWDIIADKAPDWKLKIFCDGPEFNKLNRQINKLKRNDSIEFAGVTNDIQKEIMKSSIFVMTSRYEGFGMTMLESMACGLPIIAFDCRTGPRFLLNGGEYGILCENQNINVFANELLKFMNSYELRRDFGDKSFERAKEFSWNIIGKKWDDIILNL